MARVTAARARARAWAWASEGARKRTHAAHSSESAGRVNSFARPLGGNNLFYLQFGPCAATAWPRPLEGHAMRAGQSPSAGARVKRASARLPLVLAFKLPSASRVLEESALAGGRFSARPTSLLLANACWPGALYNAVLCMYTTTFALYVHHRGRRCVVAALALKSRIRRGQAAAGLQYSSLERRASRCSTRRHKHVRHAQT